MSVAPQVPMPVLTQLQAVYQRDPEADSVALVWPEPLSEQQLITQVNGLEVRFVYCVSELAMRETLVNHALDQDQNSTQGRLVLLSRFDEVHLAKDVLARLWKNEPQRISPWKTLQQLIRVREIDPRLTKHSGKWMAEALLGCFDRYQGLITFGEVLDQENAWQALVLGYLCYQEPSLDLESVIHWSVSEDVDTLVENLPADVRDNLGDWLSIGLPKTHELITAFLLKGHGSELLPLGIACSVLFSTELEQSHIVEPSQLHLSRGVFRERYLGGKGYGQNLFQRLGDSAGQWIQKCLNVKGYQGVSTALSKAEQILASLDLTPAARHSSMLPCGFEFRLEVLAQELEKALTSDNVVAVEAALSRLNQHSLSAVAFKRETITKATMAVRLIRWLQLPPVIEGSSANMIKDYVEQGGFCDWARSSIWSGESNESLNQAYQKLTEKVRELRDKQNYSFAQQLSTIARGDSLPAPFIPVEKTLERLLAPLSEKVPVLLLVLDGMSEAVYRRLLDDLSRHNWLELRKERQAHDGCLIAALPTVTQVSRCSLLSGDLVEGSASDEKKAFSSHELLKKIASTRSPPEVFHKQDLSSDGSGALNSNVRASIAGTEHRILATVINAIDDQLSSSSQVTVDWNFETIALLRQVLEAARESGRVVILTSDHGHVLDHDTIYQSSSEDNGERYHPVQVGSEPTDLEVKVSGDRVVIPGKSVILPWTERLRYTKSRSQGYHGGASLQEVVIPLGVFIHSNSQVVPEGWIEVPRRLPDWWEPVETQVGEFVSDYQTAVDHKSKEVRKTVKTKLMEAASEVIDDLFGGPEVEKPSETSEGTLVDQLFASAVFKQMRDRAGKAAVKEDQLRSFIELLQKNQWQVMEAVVVRELMIPKIRLRGFLAGAQKLLNVDGYRILSVDRDSQTIKINIADLKNQFELR